MHINRNCYFRLERSWKYGWSWIERVRLSKSYCDDDFVSAPSAHSWASCFGEASLWSCKSPKLVTLWQVRQLTRKSVEGWSDSESDFGLLSCHVKTKRLSLAILSICFYTYYFCIFTYVDQAISALSAQLESSWRGDLSWIRGAVVQWFRWGHSTCELWSFLGHFGTLYPPKEGVSMSIPSEVCNSMAPNLRWRMVKVWINKLHILICPH
jgi:hypothetical protein